MTDVSLLPTTGLVGTGCGWGNAGAAALGAFVGSWFGNGWGGNGFTAADVVVVKVLQQVPPLGVQTLLWII